MFETLDEHMKHDDEATTTPRERIMKWALIVVLAVALFGGLIWGVHFFST